MFNCRCHVAMSALYDYGTLQKNDFLSESTVRFGHCYC